MGDRLYAGKPFLVHCMLKSMLLESSLYKNTHTRLLKNGSTNMLDLLTPCAVDSGEASLTDARVLSKTVDTRATILAWTSGTLVHS